MRENFFASRRRKNLEINLFRRDEKSGEGVRDEPSMKALYADTDHHRVWLCDNCGKVAVLPPKVIWARCAVCGEDLNLRPIRVVNRQLVVYGERAEM